VEESCALCERHLAVTAEIDDTLQCIRRGRRARRAFGNGQRGAGMRGRPG
jgi:hypothetical protein